jgi:iron(III) transport system permease protein
LGYLYSAILGLVSGGLATLLGFALWLGIGVLLLASPSSSWASFGARLIRLLLIASCVLPLYCVVGAWSGTLQPEGVWRSLFGSSAPFSPASLSANLPGNILGRLLGQQAWALMVAIGIYSVHATPFAWLMITCGLGTLASPSRSLLLQQGLLLGIAERGFLRGLVWGILPVAWRWLLVVWLGISGWVACDMLVTNLYQIPSYCEMVYQQMVAGNYQDALRDTPLIVAITATVFTCARWLHRDRKSIASRSSVLYARDDQTLPSSSISLTGVALSRPTQRIAWFVTGSILFVLFFVPFVHLAARSGQVTRNGGGYSWSAMACLMRIVESPSRYAEEHYWSIVLGFWSTLIVLMSLAVLFLWERSKRLPKLGLLVPIFMLTILMIPSPLVNGFVLVTFQFLESVVPSDGTSNAIAWLQNHTLAAPIACLFFRLAPMGYFAFVWLSDQEKQDRGTLLRLEATSHQSLLQKVQGEWGLRQPLWLSTISVACFLFLYSLSELSCYILTLPPGVTTISMRIFELLHYGVRYQEASLLLWLGLMVAFVSASIGSFLSNKGLP